MFLPAWSPIIVVFLILYALAGTAIGMIAGWIASWAMRSDSRGVWRNALLGAFGSLAGFTGTIYMPWHENTVAELLAGGGTVATTMSMYQHPERVAIVVAVALPILHELYRSRRARTDQI